MPDDAQTPPAVDLLADRGGKQKRHEGADERIAGGIEEGAWEDGREEDDGRELKGAGVPGGKRMREVEFPEDASAGGGGGRLGRRRGRR